MSGSRARSPRRSATLSQRLALAACLLFTLVGAMPLLAELLLRASPIQAWAVRETSRLLAEELGVEARFQARVSLLPLQLEVLGLEVPATDGLGPALVVPRLRVTPRLFSLLSGQLDTGDIELRSPRARLVLQAGKVSNVAYKLKPSSKPQKGPDRAPFTTLAVLDAKLDLDLGPVRLRTEAVDLELFSSGKQVFEVTLRTGPVSVSQALPAKLDEPQPGVPTQAPLYTYEDQVCDLELRAQVTAALLLVRRLELTGLMDLPRLGGKPPSCAEQEPADSPRRVEVGLSQLRLLRRAEGSRGEFHLHGDVKLRAPVQPVARYVHLDRPSGWVSLTGTVDFDSSQRLPEFRGTLAGNDLRYGPARVAESLTTEVELSGNVIRMPLGRVRWANGNSELRNVRIAPFEPGAPLTADALDGTDMTFPGIMREVGVTPNTIVGWDLKRTRVRNIRATLRPFKLHAELTGETRDFQVFDRAFHDPARSRIVGVEAASLSTIITVDLKSFTLENVRSDFGKSTLRARFVSIGFDNHLKLSIDEATRLHLADISPLANLPIAGTARLTASLDGDPQHTPITGTFSAEGFELGGFPLGDVLESKVKFVPLKLDVTELKGRKNKSLFSVPQLRLSFDTGASVLAEAKVKSGALDVRDFFHMFHFDQDPRYDAISGSLQMTASIRYAFGGPEDRCGGGRLSVEGSSKLHQAELYEERYSGGSSDFRFDWFDQQASYLGMRLEVPSFALEKGSGTLVGSFKMERGAKLSGNVLATRIALSRLDGLGLLGNALGGHASGAASISGTLDAMELDGAVELSPITVATQLLPPSAFKVKLRPLPPNKPTKAGTTRCGNPISAPFSRADWAEDRPDGTFSFSGQLFGGQIAFEDLRLTRQRNRFFSGEVHAQGLQLRPWAELSPDALVAEPVRGQLTGSAKLAHFSTRSLGESSATLNVEALKLERGQLALELLTARAPLELVAGRLRVAPLTARLRTLGGAQVLFDAKGEVRALGSAKPELDLQVDLRPAEFSALAQLIPRATRATGTFDGSLLLKGPLSAPRYEGRASLRRGSLKLSGLTAPLTDLEVDVALTPEELRVVRGEASLGGGRVTASGAAELLQGALVHGRLNLAADNVTLTLQDGVRATFNAGLAVTSEGTGAGRERSLPKVEGTVIVKSARYTRGASMTADIDSITQSGSPTDFTAYDPEEDLVELDVRVLAEEPISVENSLIRAQVVFDPRGLSLTGTNQRFGLRGSMSLKPGGMLVLRRNEFEIRQGNVRFDDSTRIAPQVDVTAVTEYHRHAQGASSGQEESSADASAATREGRWTITLRAHGDADRLKIDLSSEPRLSQDDIFLLLTVGLTRAELDQARSASVGEGVALEALGSLTGADQAVADAVPVIDQFQFGSAYSSRSGRTEPTITIGKRLAERLRANIRSGLGEAREVQSNIEWRLSPQVSLEGSYDNVNDISSSTLGNLGADIRWRLEFQ